LFLKILVKSRLVRPDHTGLFRILSLSNSKTEGTGHLNRIDIHGLMSILTLFLDIDYFSFCEILFYIRNRNMFQRPIGKGEQVLEKRLDQKELTWKVTPTHRKSM
jgi:hypothetical protein